eukprot:CAMPEP_0174265412 /NCGR_PEP_ID=MMETSP0439-20130205/26394_1 /TAXON_ID=0 /ORGANISM="Stereomyxa ramosa, Strain Chinc5" /LENGTH=56 /DNA_ID=CAMNT_0015351851 /DNA_START=357 /DNA_END=527 /DNA_ORIENTATION=-
MTLDDLHWDWKGKMEGQFESVSGKESLIGKDLYLIGVLPPTIFTFLFLRKMRASLH